MVELFPEADQIRRHFDALSRPGEVREVRILEHVPASGRGRPATASGYFDTADDLVKAIAGIGSNHAKGIYITQNAVDGRLLARAANRLQSGAKQTTADADVPRRQHLTFDFDPVRPAGISATDAERDQALATRDSFLEFTLELGWPAPVVQLMSGNGGMLTWRIDLPADDIGRELLAAVLETADAQFSTCDVSVDTTLVNPSRIVKVAGTAAAKGDPLPNRPHRLAVGEFCPDAAKVPDSLLRSFAALAPDPEAGTRPEARRATRGSSGAAYDVPALLNAAGIGYREWDRAYARVYELDECLTSTAHSDGASILQFPSGAVAYRCLHNTCAGVGWQDVKALLGITGGRAHGRKQHGTNGPRSHAEDIVDDPEPEPWQRPELLPEGERPEFPVALLGEPLASYVAALSHATQTPSALVALMVLGVLAIAAAKRVSILVRDGWSEPVNLYLLAALPPGNRKSAVEAAVGKPLREFEATEAERMVMEIGQVRARRDAAEKRLEHLQRCLARADNRDETLKLEAEMQELVARLLTDESLQVPVAPRYLVDDVTPERLAALMAEHDGRMGVLSAEGGIFQTIAGRYSEKRADSLDLFLKGHAGDDMPIDRVGRPTKHLHAPALTMALAVQPEVLAGLATQPGFRGRGLLARFVYACPLSRVGRRVIAPPPVSWETEQAYGALIVSVLRLSDGNAPLTLAPDAAATFLDFERALEPRLGPDGDLEHLADWGAKLAGLVARLAALLHVAQCVVARMAPAAHPIRAETVAAAAKIADSFLIPHARTAFAVMGADPALEKARRILRVIVAWPEETVSRRDLHQHLRATFPRPEDFDRPLAVLCEHEYLRPVTTGPVGPGRRPSPRYEINPLRRPQNTHNTQNADPEPGCEDSVHCEGRPESPNGHTAANEHDAWAGAERVRL